MEEATFKHIVLERENHFTKREKKTHEKPKGKFKKKLWKLLAGLSSRVSLKDGM